MLSVNITLYCVLSCVTVCILCCVMSLRYDSGWIKTVLLLLLLHSVGSAESSFCAENQLNLFSLIDRTPAYAWRRERHRPIPYTALCLYVAYTSRVKNSESTYWRFATLLKLRTKRVKNQHDTHTQMTAIFYSQIKNLEKNSTVNNTVSYR